MAAERFTVEDRPTEQRYVLIDQGEAGTENGAEGSAEVVAGEESYVDVVPQSGPTQRVLFHTGVDEVYAGQGLASVLVQAVIDDVLARGLAIVPVCPYVARWLTKHPEYAAHVVDPAREHLAAVRTQQ